MSVEWSIIRQNKVHKSYNVIAKTLDTPKDTLSTYILLKNCRNGDCDGKAMPNELVKNFSCMRAALQFSSGSAKYVSSSSV